MIESALSLALYLMWEGFAVELVMLLVGPAIALFGIWIATLRVNRTIKEAEERRIRTHISSFLEIAYLDVENFVQRKHASLDDEQRFESALARIQLLGDEELCSEAHKLTE